MSVDYSLEYYQGILSQISKWRVIPLRSLREISGYQGSKQSFYRVIRTLENRNLIRTKKLNGKSKVVTLSPELTSLSMYRHADLQEESITHEALVASICQELLTWEIFESVTLPYEIVSKGYDSGIRRLPDALVEGKNQGKSFKMALEIEITRKSKTRVQNKVEDYLKNDVFDFIFYIFNERSTFESYKRFITEVFQRPLFSEGQNNHDARFIFGYKENLIGTMCRIEDLELYYRGKATSLESIFGKRRGVT